MANERIARIKATAKRKAYEQLDTDKDGKLETSDLYADGKLTPAGKKVLVGAVIAVILLAVVLGK